MIIGNLYKFDRQTWKDSRGTESNEDFVVRALTEENEFGYFAGEYVETNGSGVIGQTGEFEAALFVPCTIPIELTENQIETLLLNITNGYLFFVLKYQLPPKYADRILQNDMKEWYYEREFLA